MQHICTNLFLIIPLSLTLTLCIFLSSLFSWFGLMANANREPSLTNSIYNYAIVSTPSPTETHKSPVKSPQTTMLSIPKWKMKWKNVSKWRDHYAEPMPTKITHKCVVMLLIFDLNCDFLLLWHWPLFWFGLLFWLLFHIIIIIAL